MNVLGSSLLEVHHMYTIIYLLYYVYFKPQKLTSNILFKKFWNEFLMFLKYPQHYFIHIYIFNRFWESLWELPTIGVLKQYDWILS